MFKRVLLFTFLISFLGATNCEFHKANKTVKPSGILTTLKDTASSGVKSLGEIAVHPATLTIAGFVGTIYLMYKLKISNNTLDLIGSSLYLINNVLVATMIIRRC